VQYVRANFSKTYETEFFEFYEWTFASNPFCRCPPGSLHSAGAARDCRHRSWIPGSTTLPVYTLLG